MLNDLAFRWACESGHLEVAKWLLSVKPDINISAQNEEAFSYACKKGHLEFAKWLLQMKPDINISANNEYAFEFKVNKDQFILSGFVSNNVIALGFKERLLQLILYI